MIFRKDISYITSGEISCDYDKGVDVASSYGIEDLGEN